MGLLKGSAQNHEGIPLSYGGEVEALQKMAVL